MQAVRPKSGGFLDFALLHPGYTLSGAAVVIGENTSVAHRSIVHGPCKVGHGVFIGFNSVLFNCTVTVGDRRAYRCYSRTGSMG